MKKIKFVRDYKVLLASQKTTIYHAGDIINCRGDEKAQQMIDRGFAVEVNE